MLSLETPTTRMAQVSKRLASIRKPLHDHQHDGVNWMLKLEQDGSGGILADDPGVGKTLQALSLAFSSPEGSCTLIVVPTSILKQWRDAATEFLGKDNVYVHHGSKRDKQHFPRKRVVITTYGLMKTETKLSTIHWFRIILDEIHEIRNRGSKGSKAIMDFSSKYRWGLSGTPVHNSKEQVVNLFRFVKGFPSDSHEPIDLEAIIKTHLLRRRKEVVLKDMIPTIEISTEVIDFNTKRERLFYEKIEKNVKAEFEQLEEQCLTASEENVIMFELLLRLRQAAQHPKLVLSGFSRKYKTDMGDWKHVSSKHVALLNFIKEHPREGSLVFCQFTEEMDILEKYLYQNGMEVMRLDGKISTSERERVLDTCNQKVDALSALPEIPVNAQNVLQSFIRPKVFLIQIKAGGVGLNLQSFSRVYITSPDWNPCNEIQAIARAHRLGQKRKVIVKKLVLKNGEKALIDDRICAIQEKKREMMADLLEEDSLKCNGKRKKSLSGLSTSDYRSLLGK